MRITGGVYGGHPLKVPGGDLRPTQDRVREALFSMLGERVVRSRFLDLFAGSGAVGLDAFSRGAEVVWWVESNRRTLDVLKDNVSRILKGNMEKGLRFVCGKAISFLEKGLESQKFDLIFADPPYERRGGEDLPAKLLEAVCRGNRMEPGGLFVMEQSASTPVTEVGGWTVIKDRVYGETRLVFFKRSEEGGGSND